MPSCVWDFYDAKEVVMLFSYAAEMYLPDASSYAPLAHRQSNNVAQLWVPAKGESDLYLYIYTQVDANWDNYISGVASYFY